MSYDEAFVGSLAIGFSIAAVVIAFGSWDLPYRLHSVSAFQRRFGKPAARGLWVAVGVALLMAGISIFNGFRPSYAQPSQHSAIDQ